MMQWLVRRGALVTAPAVALMLAFNACSSETGSSDAEATSASDAAPPVTEGAEAPADEAAIQRLTHLTNRFVHLPPLAKQLAASKRPAGALPPRPEPAEKPLEPAPVLRKGDAARFIRMGSRLRAEVPAELKVGAGIAATTHVPTLADGFTRVQPDGGKVGIEFATKGARRNVAAGLADGTVVYPGGAAEGGDIILRVTAHGVEDFVVLNERPSSPFVEYAVNVDEVAGLRLYDNTLEFLDKAGDPQVRVKPPHLTDADGVNHPAKLELEGCAADRSGLPPWNRAVTAPGAAECTVRVSWNDAKVVYPAIVDPVWATAASLATERWKNAAIRLSTGLVLTCGGEDKNGVPIASCEAFNPAGGVGGAGAWAAVTSMNTARAAFALVSLSPASSDVVAVGGTSLTTSERYNGATWSSSVGNYSAGYFQPQAMPAVTSDGEYVVVIDYDATPFRLATSNNTWTTGTNNPAPLQQYRYGAHIVGIPGQGSIMRAGGYYSVTYSEVERYNPSTDSWSNPGNAASMTLARQGAAVAILDANRLMIYGGSNSNSLSSAEIYNALTNTWSFTPDPLPGGNTAYAGTGNSSYAFHSSGKMLSATDSNLYLYDPTAASNPWSVLDTSSQGFYHMGSRGNAVTAGSKVLLVPVQPSGASSGVQTECRLFDLGNKGSVCSASAECQSGLTCSTADAYDGVRVCCDTACSGGCMSCRAAHKVSGTDGTCGPRNTTEQVYGFCSPSDASTCGNDYSYACDGLGACAKWPNGTVCENGSCKDGDTQNNPRTCDGAGTCKAQTSTDCPGGFQCSSGNGNQCLTSCYNDADYCTPNYFCQTWYDPADNANQYKCLAKKDTGSACSGNSATECKSGYCVDGFCCEAACSGVCEACSAVLTGQSNGTCKPVLANTPSFECYEDSASSCGTNGKCDGAGACQLYPANTVCSTPSCATATSRNIVDTCNGTGSCVDQGTQNCATGYACLNGACQTSCNDDTQCASAYYCDLAAKQCVPDKTQGQACPRSAACPNNENCVDGVCCDSDCTGTCRSCVKNRTGLPSDGVCGDTLDDTDPESECTIGAGYPGSCQAPGLCNGQGACRPYAKDTVECDADVCTGSTLTTYSCNGSGTCKAKAVQCYPFQCDTANNVCRVACTVDVDCVEGSACENGTCVGQLENGQSCTRPAQCKTGFCANIGEGGLAGDESGAGGAGAGPEDIPGVCCDTSCQGTCSGCKASIKGFGSDGVCEFVKNNTDPGNDCDPAASDACGLDGQCNGSGACRLAPTGSACGATSCQGNSVLGQSCNGQGDCINNQGGIDCAPYLCRDVAGAFQCTNPCVEDNDCQDGYFCSEASCKKKLGNGQACESNGICNSGFCVDGVCCDTSCNGQCAACDNAGSEGICGAVKGEPHGNRTKCDHAGEECGGSCDGVNTAACKYVATGTECGATTCDNGIAKSSECNGQGECRGNKNVECSPYVCGPDDLCLELCEQDADCSQGYACDETARRCLPSAVAAVCSEDRQTSIGQNGQTPCKPFLCVPASGTCAVSCAFTTDCAPDFVCEAATKTCLPTPPESEVEDESCACRAVGASSPRHGYLALAALGLAFGALRRRRRLREFSRPLAGGIAPPAGPSPVRVSRCRP